jgi:hypothetical protein
MGSLFSGPKINTTPITNAISAGMKKADLNPVSLNAGGLSSTLKKGVLSITPSADRVAQVNNLASQFGAQAGELSTLRSQYAPGYSALRAAQLASIENARQSAVSNLRDNLARRRVLGSSFASDAETRANLDFENQKNNVISDTYLKELDATNNLINEEYTARVNQVSTGLNELNLEANTGATLVAQANQVLTNSAQLQTQIATQGISTLGQINTAQAQLDAGAQSGAGSLFGYLAGKVLSPGGIAATALA